MANIRKMPSGSWQAAVYIGRIDGKRKYEYITKATQKECKAAAAALETEIEEGKYIYYLGEAMDRYNDSMKTFISPTTYSSYVRYANKSFEPLRNVVVKTITSEVIQKHFI